MLKYLVFTTVLTIGTQTKDHHSLPSPRTMAEESDIDRKARIMALAARAKAKKGETKEKTLTFRNYNISDNNQEEDHTSKKRKTTDKKSELELALIEAKRQLAMSKDGKNTN